MHREDIKGLQFNPHLKERYFLLLNFRQDAPELFTNLSELYQNRPYHNLQHIEHCFNVLDIVSKNVLELELAIFYHDCVYDPTKKNNEELSAEYFENTFKNKLPQFIVDIVKKLILDTKHIKVPKTDDGKLLVDIDLSILGSDPKDFAIYEQCIREEYSFVEDSNFIAGRKAILESFLNREYIFHTDQLRNMFEKQARANLTSALARLAQDASCKGFA